MREPLAIRSAVVAAVNAVVALLISLGVIDVTSEQAGAIYLAVSSISAAVLVVWTRGKVTPVDDPISAEGLPLAPATNVPGYETL